MLHVGKQFIAARRVAIGFDDEAVWMRDLVAAARHDRDAGRRLIVGQGGEQMLGV